MLETRISFIEKLANGIIRVQTKEDIVLKPEDLDENYKAYSTFMDVENDKGLFLVIFASNGESNIESRLKFADPTRNKIKKAEALVVGSLYQRIESNFYKSFAKPKHPVQIFNNEKEAIEWLLSISDD